MKILFIVPKFNFTKKVLIDRKNYNYVFPIGMGYIISALKEAGYPADCINLNHIEGNTKDIINKKLDSKRYDFVCISNMSNGYSLTELVLKTVREHPTSPTTILGGLIITCEPELVFETLKPDYGVIGEGEEAVVELLDALSHNKSLEKIRGLIFKKENKTIFTGKRENNRDINSIPFPDLESMGLREYLDNTHPNFWGNQVLSIMDYPRPYPILGSRSCPFNCTFCGHISRYKQRSIDNIMKELEENVEKYNINLIFMYDDCFTLKLDRVYEFCKRIKELQKRVGREIKWGTSMTVKGVTPELLKTMKDAGCFTVSFGFESYDENVLKSMRKPITPKEIDIALKYSEGIGMMIYAGFIFGDVAETKESARRTLKYWVDVCQKQKLGFINLGFIQPFPGTGLYDYCLKKGLIKDKLEFLKNVELMGRASINMTEKMTDKEFRDLEKTVLNLVAKYKKFVTPKKMIKTGKNIYSMKVQCPLCYKETEYKNNFIENRLSFGFITVCRNCGGGFWVTSPIQKWAYKHLSFSVGIKGIINKIKNSLAKKVG